MLSFLYFFSLLFLVVFFRDHRPQFHYYKILLSLQDLQLSCCDLNFFWFADKPLAYPAETFYRHSLHFHFYLCSIFCHISSSFVFFIRGEAMPRLYISLITTATC